MVRLGLTHVLPRLFFPQYKFNRLTPRVRVTSGLRKRAARTRGCRIDREILVLALTGHLPQNATREAVRLDAFFRTQGFSVESAQTPVSHHQWRLRSNVDVVLTNARNERVVVEVKRGCAYRHSAVPHATSRFLDPPVAVNPFHLHQLQALAGAKLLELETKQIIHDVWLIYVDDTTLECVRRAQFKVCWSHQLERVLATRSL